MSNQEYERSRDALDALTRELVSSPQKALDFLVQAGIVTPSGELTAPYRQPERPHA